MTKFEFKPEDFCLEWDDCRGKRNVNIANTKIQPLLARLNELEAMIENAPLVKSSTQSTWVDPETTHGVYWRYRGRVVCIEEIG